MASATFIFLLIVLSISLTSLIGESATQTKKAASSKDKLILPGSSLSPMISTHKSSWPSPSGNFEFGFYEEQHGFAIGIWLVGADERTVVWTANRDDPPVNSNAELVFTTSSGKLLLRSGKGEEKRVIANTTSSASSASMLDSGNFVLRNSTSDIIWESFNHPTDTILQGQVLPTLGQLFSSVSDTNHSTGRYHLWMQADGNLVLYPANTEDSSEDAYWATNTWPPKDNLNLYLNSTGLLSLVETTNTSELLDYSYLNDESSLSKDKVVNGTVIYRATVNADGNFKLYSHLVNKKKKDPQDVFEVWSALRNPCEVKGRCGLNSYCTLNDVQPNCVCLPGTEYADPDRWSLGCLRNYSKIECESDGKEKVKFYKIIKTETINWEATPYVELQMSTEENCSNSCLEDCNCEAAMFELNDIHDGIDNYNRYVCRKQKLPLSYVKRDFDSRKTAFFKVRKGSENTGSTEKRSKDDATDKKVLIQIIVLALCSIVLSCVALVISGFYFAKIRVLRYKKLRDDGILGNTTHQEEVTLRVFSYNELKRATNGFKEELGKGSFGAVYKGSLNKGKKLVAVKRLEKLGEEGEREFRAEMRAIGRTNHKNLVRLFGYCAEGSRRVLVYEYMSNGSLADLLFKNAMGIGWEERVRIAVDVARGILYLHEECKVPIIHCDIKPQNILMDEVWSAKISDFGLAKLLMPDQTRTFTVIRGTRGYMAPEWHKNTPISVKADVYSYGIVLLEIVCCRRNFDANVSDADEIVLSSWVCKCFAARELKKLVNGEEVDNKTLENVVKVALWCIQDEPALRPSMKSVVLMLEGITDVAIPPCPTST
ncbi:G-type lectin S-receptor-like serine/threonine-protein kinase RLK1 [Morus notabilis]|uniref:Receptor-like serine/threonine-protein kinase n=1 Tax=Morus notabilis TaxID=981085 RepID=W9S242_9ROSA|nr:G-type lectin S-receptor-like serine/threonine-protein kinase LECRK2 [Morus notabilis]EXB82944.1 G-type lectin S-receptor-like serine/threonine-protein kinase RLK1 [Morus notabilis]